jgi:Zinc knuckle
MVKEIRAELSLHFEILNMNSTKNGDVEESEEHALFSVLKGKCRNCGQIGHKSFQCKNRPTSNHNGGNYRKMTGRNYYTYCRKPVHVNQMCSNQRTRILDTTMIKPVAIITVIATWKTMTHKMSYLQPRPRLRGLQTIYRLVTAESLGIIVPLKRVCRMFNV